MKLFNKLTSKPVQFTTKPPPPPFPQYLKSVLILFLILLLAFLKTSSQQVHLPNSLRRNVPLILATRPVYLGLRELSLPALLKYMLKTITFFLMT